jgi:hypothetical protein
MELNLHDEWLMPVAGAAYTVVFEDGTQRQGHLDANGHARLEGVPNLPARVFYGEDPAEPEARVALPANDFQPSAQTNERPRPTSRLTSSAPKPSGRSRPPPSSERFVPSSTTRAPASPAKTSGTTWTKRNNGRCSRNCKETAHERRNGGGQGGAAVAQAERSGWFDSIKNEALSFVKGDNNAPWAILAETVIGCVPILGQVVDARDIIKGLVEVSGAPASPLAWFNLITALIGLIPGGGDAAKRALRSVKAGATQVDDLLAMIRRIYKGDPEALLRKVLDLSTLRKSLDDILADSRLTSRLSPELKQSVEGIRTNLTKQFDSFKKEVDGWLAKGARPAPTATGAKAPTGTPTAKPETHAKAGTQEKAPTAIRPNPRRPTRPSSARPASKRWPTSSWA